MRLKHPLTLSLILVSLVAIVAFILTRAKSPTTVFSAIDQVTLSLPITSSSPLLLSPTNQPVTTPISLSKLEGQNVATITPPSPFQPGVYTLKTDQGSQTFPWGVLVLNTDQDKYRVGQTVLLQIASLDKHGRTLCNSNLVLQIDGQLVPITKSSDCGADNVTDIPDFTATYTPTKEGDQKVVLTNLDNNWQITSTLHVVNNPSLIVKRLGATRINPFKAQYLMQIEVTSSSPQTVDITESLPPGFTSPNQVGGNIFWHSQKLDPETPLHLSYTYQADRLSPAIFTLGPLAVGDQKEASTWQLASDAPDSAYSFQRKTWYDGTRYWRSYYDSTDGRLEFEYSSDGSSWTEDTSARITTGSSDFSVEADSSNAFIAYTNGYDIEVRKTSSYPGTSFSWGSATVAYDGASATNYYRYPTLSYDTGSKVWVSAMQYETGTIDAFITADDNDGTEEAATTWHQGGYNGGGQNYHGYYSGNDNSGYRFVSLTIPQGAQIDSATLSLRGTSIIGAADAVKLKVSATDADNPGVWSSSNRPSQQTKTSAQVDWDLSSWSTSGYNTSPSITSVIQEIVDRSGWSSGNAIAINVMEDGTTGGNNEVAARDYNGDTSQTANLDIVYTAHKISVRQSSSANDISSWGTATILDTSTSTNKYAVLSPRTSGAMYAVWTDGTALEGKNYNGSSWDASPTSIDTVPGNLQDSFSAVGDGSGNVYLEYIDDESTDQVSVVRYNGTSWGSAALVPDAADNNDSYPTLTYDSTGSDLYAFWIDTSSSDIYYSKCDVSTSCDTASEWDSEVAWQTSGANTYVTSNYSGDGKVFAQWLDGTTIAWDDVSFNTPPSTPSLDSPADSATNQSLTPALKTTTTDTQSDYLRYKIELCTNVGMSSGCQTFDQTGSQTGWSGQNTETSTAYTSGTQGTYTVQSALSTATTYYWRSYAIDPGGTNTWSSTQGTPRSFTTTTAPSSPTTPYAEGTSNPTGIVDLTPEFSAIHNDANADPAVYYEIEVNTASNFGGTVMWDTGQTSMSSLADGARSADVSYAGTTLTYNATTYYWRIRFADNKGAVGAWSATQSFSTNSPPSTPSLDSPADTATGVSVTPALQTTATDTHSDYLRYKIELCTNVGMSSGCQTFDQTGSQTGWSGQNTQTSTAYTSGTQGTYTVQSALSTATTYYWRSYAIDPGGTNTWSSTQGSPSSFTTTAPPPPGSQITNFEGISLEGISIE